MSVRILQGDCLAVLETLPADSVHCCVTSPPYWGLRDYGTATWEGGDADCEHRGRAKPRQDTHGAGIEHGRFSVTRGTQPAKNAYVIPVRAACQCGATRIDAQLGLEATPAEYIEKMVAVFREVRRVLRDDGTLWLNLGDSYAASRSYQVSDNKNPGAVHSGHESRARPPDGLKQKDLVGIPWRVAFALQADGWYLRQDIIWAKPNPMPESVRDRCTKSHEYLFLLAKSERYYFDAAGISEPCTGAERDQIDARSFRVGDDNKSAPTGMVNGIRKRSWKTPDGWDTSKGAGGHGSFHKDGREAGHTGYVSRSGNKERKPASARGVPIDTGGQSAGAVAGSVPWEGTTRNKRSVWTIATQPFKEAHFATFPPALIEPCILAGCPRGGGSARPLWGRRNHRPCGRSPAARRHPDRTEPGVRRNG